MTSKRLCTFGDKCNKGEACRFGHPERATSSSSSDFIQRTTKPKKKCNFGSFCKRRPDCPFDPSDDLSIRPHTFEADIVAGDIRGNDSSVARTVAETSVPSAMKREIKRLQFHLPIYARRKDLVDAVRSNSVLILKADTGSGKSTQLVQYLFDAGFADQRQIVCTQPRRLAARALASRVADEFGCEVGEEIGYRVGANRPCLSNSTRIRFVTDSVLLSQYHDDPKLSLYSIVIIDEAHERRIDTDLLFGIMKLCLRDRSDLKLIIMSATLDADLFQRYYQQSCILEVAGRTYPIEDEYASDDIDQYVEAAVAKVYEIHHSKDLGDILVFLTGPDEIDRSVDDVQTRLKDTAIVLPLHGKLNEEDTKRIFVPTPADKRKIIFSTNVAETSVTIDGIRHVVESGMVKQSMWDEKRKMQVLKIGNITQSSVKQRRGRAGRTSAGKCYHLYTKEMYDSFDICPRAEILCIQPSIAVLKLKYLGVVDDVENFEWLETPSVTSIRDAVKSLTWLNAIDSTTGQLTKTGQHMAELGLSPMLSAMILYGKEKSCTSHVLALAGMLSVAQSVWWRGKDTESKQLADEKRAYFSHENDRGGDHIQLLKIFLEWNALGRSGRSEWCRKNMINGKAMNMALEFANETARQLKINKLDFAEPAFDQVLVDNVLSSVAAGYFQNLAISNGSLRSGYQLASSDKINAQVHRSSTLTIAMQPPSYALYHEILNLNGTNCMTIMCPVELQAIPQAWLASLPRPPADRVFVSHTFSNLGPTLLSACFGKRFAKKQQLEDVFQAVLDADYAQGTLTIWCHTSKLAGARRGIEELLSVEREKLVTEAEEYVIVGSTRVLLGAGCCPLQVLLENEYVKVIVRGLPGNATEQQVEEKFRQCGKVRSVNFLQKASDGASASVSYYETAHARQAVVRLSEETWQKRRITVGPANVGASVHASTQTCKLKVQWFLTESECNGKVVLSKREAAEQALEVLPNVFACRCKMKMNTSKPTVKCYWPNEKHTGMAIIDFRTDEEAQQKIQERTIGQMRLHPGQKKSSSLCAKNVPKEFDEEDLKDTFPNCTRVMLFRGEKNAQLQIPDDADQDIRRVFAHYQSFQHDSVMISSKLLSGRVEALVHFNNEGDALAAIAQMNGHANLIGVGKLRMSLVTQTRNVKATMSRDEYVVEMSGLSSTLIEEDVLNELRQHPLVDSISNVFIFRKKLVEEVGEEKTNPQKRTLQVDLNRLTSLFISPTHFRSAPEININPATADGRVTAHVLYDNPDDVVKAMQLYQNPANPDLLQFGQHKLHLAPLNDHVIVLNASLANAIRPKIQSTLEEIRKMCLLNVTVRMKETGENAKKVTRIYIQGTDNLQIAKVRTIFSRLMKGLEFRFHDPSWVSIIFGSTGKNFLKSLQERTKTYIWWNWSSTFLRIFGDDEASNEAYREIDTFIQNTILNSKHSISVSMPQGSLRQCLKKAKEFKSLGNDGVAVEINMIKRIISITGEQTAARDCENRVRALLASLPQLTTTNDNNAECPLCLGPCEAPYALQQCGHMFCRVCLYDFFVSRCDSTLSLNAFKICCLADGCDALCLIRDVKSVLGSGKMEQLAKIAFQIYLKQPGVDLAQCIGNDCQQVYRPSQNPSKYTCDQCVKDYCVPCQVEYHAGLTCEEQQKLLAKERDERLLVENLGNLGFKRCPQCNVMIEKYAGCNAVKCTQCSIAFCWLCSATNPVDAHPHFYDKSTSCYGKTFS